MIKTKYVTITEFACAYIQVLPRPEIEADFDEKGLTLGMIGYEQNPNEVIAKQVYYCINFENTDMIEAFNLLLKQVSYQTKKTTKNNIIYKAILHLKRELEEDD